MLHLCQSHSGYQTTGSWPPQDPKLTCVAGKLSINMLAIVLLLTWLSLEKQLVGGTISQDLLRCQ